MAAGHLITIDTLHEQSVIFRDVIMDKEQLDYRHLFAFTST
jgi:hypothetical protein